jgi:UDP-3-O-[3-hydroxymyristoyl] glucosamine N-acyltransferase
MIITVRELSGRLGCPFEGDGAVEISGVADLPSAGPGDLVFVVKPKLLAGLEASAAAAVILPPGLGGARIPVIRAADPQLAFVRTTAFFFQAYRPDPGIHPAAVISPTARIGRDVSIGAYCVVGDGAEIGEGSVLFPLASVYPRASLGEGCVIHSHASIREGVRLGRRVIVHNGAVIGADGFGYVRDETGAPVKIPQKGTVVVEDDVEIGPNAAVDRAALGETVVRRGAKIDALVMVAHNVEIGEGAILMAQAGVAGSSKIGRNTFLCGQVGVADHLDVGEGVVIAAKSGVTGHIRDGAFVSGSPHLDIRDWRKFWAVAPQIYDLVKEFKRLKARVEELEKKDGRDG